MTAVVHPLNANHRAEVERHLEQLPLEERAPAGSIDFARDVAFGLFEPALAGVAHLAPAEQSGTARLALSVAPDRRGKGYGYALLSIAGAHAARLGLRRLFIHGLAGNRVLVHLARKAGMTVVRSNLETDSHIALQPRFEERPAPRRRWLLDWFAALRPETP